MKNLISHNMMFDRLNEEDKKKRNNKKHNNSLTIISWLRIHYHYCINLIYL